MTQPTPGELRPEELFDRLRDLAREGNTRRVVVKSKSGERLVELPLTLGVVGALLAPTLAVVGTVAALATECTIEVESRNGSDG